MIRGPSGGGKTTMLNLVGTIDSSSSGELLIMGQKIDKDSSDDFLSQLRLKHIGFVF
jgi:putative ABC transport system ATP-binding protein